MKNDNDKNLKRERRRARNRAKIFGTSVKPRLSVFRSNNYTYAQLIDDEKKVTIVSASTRELKGSANKTSQAKSLGQLIGQKSQKAGIKEAVFNKGSYLYHGRIKAVAEGARESGLKL